MSIQCINADESRNKEAQEVIDKQALKPTASYMKQTLSLFFVLFGIITTIIVICYGSINTHGIQLHERNSTTITISPVILSTNNKSDDKCKSNLNIQKDLDTLINHDIPQILFNYNESNNVSISPKTGIDLLTLFQNKRVLFHGDSIISLFFELLSQFLYYCTPSSNISNITAADEHPCGKQFCDFLWSKDLYHSLFIIDSSIKPFGECVLNKMGGGWSEKQSVGFLKNYISRIQNDDHQTVCSKFEIKQKNIQIYYCNEYLKYDEINKLISENNTNIKDIIKIPYDIIIDEMGLMHIFQSIDDTQSKREFEENAIEKMYNIESIIKNKIKYHSLYNNNKSKCYIFMSMDPICESLIYYEHKHDGSDSKAQLKWKLIQEKLGFNHLWNSSNRNHFNFNYSLLTHDDLVLIDQCFKKSKQRFISLRNDTKDDEIKEYCITHAWTDYSALFISKQVRNTVLNISRETEFCNDNIYYYDQYKLFHQFSDRCTTKHHRGRAHSAGFYPLQLIAYLNLFDFAHCSN